MEQRTQYGSFELNRRFAFFTFLSFIAAFARGAGASEHASLSFDYGQRRLVSNAVYWGLGMESFVAATRGVENIGNYQPRESGFNYHKLGVSPHAGSFYR